MAPEQVRGLAADHRADIFAFGAVLYEMLSGRRAFRGETTADTMTAILKEDPPDLPAAERHIPPALARIVDRCLEKSPARGSSRRAIWRLRSRACHRSPTARRLIGAIPEPTVICVGSAGPMAALVVSRSCWLRSRSRSLIYVSRQSSPAPFVSPWRRQKMQRLQEGRLIAPHRRCRPMVGAWCSAPSAPEVRIFSGCARSMRSRLSRCQEPKRGEFSVLVAGQPFHRVLRRRQAQEDRILRRPVANAV